MATYLCSDPVFRRHVPPTPHAEGPDRLQAIADALSTACLPARCQTLQARPATQDELRRVHTPDYVAKVLALLGPDSSQPSGWLDPDTYYGPGSLDAALAAAGAAADMAQLVLAGGRDNGMLLCRPPGHHATHDRAMGFCIFNNIAVAAAAARAQGARVAIVDIDVHHGNGTEDIFSAEPNPLFICLHQFPLYPGTGPGSFMGTGAGLGSTINLPLPCGSDDAVYELCFDKVVLPALQRFAPDLLLVSAGFDAHAGDPLAGMQVSTTGYARMIRRLLQHTPRLMAVLEGGYHRQALAESVTAVVHTLLGDEVAGAGEPPGSQVPEEIKDRVAAIQHRHHL